MHPVLVHHARTRPVASPALLDDMYGLRCRVFRDRLQWDINCENNRDIDFYDRMHPVYAIATPDRRTATGCWRILPTSGPNMLRDIFPALVETGPMPEAKNVWEISRFAVDTLTPTYESLASLHATTSELLIKLVEYGLENGIKRFVAASDVRFERILKRSGLDVKRLGKVQRIGRTPAVSGYIDVTPEQLDQVYDVANRVAAEHQQRAA